MRLPSLLFVVAAVAAAQAPTVVSVNPAKHARGVSAAAPVTLTFSVALDPATVVAANFRVAGRWSGPVPGSLALNPSGAAVTFQPSRPYFAGEWVSVFVSHNVHAAGGAALAGGFTSVFLVDSASSTNTFSLQQVINFRLPGEGLIRTYGFFAGDVDRDGSPDMSATNEVAYDVRLLKNTGCGTYGAATITPLPAGNEPSPNDGGDLNGDGWLDFVTGNQNGSSIAVFMNDGAGNYLAPAIYGAGGQVHGMALLDADSDGDLDVAAANFTNVAILLNQGAGTFAAATYINGGGQGEWGLAVGDANGDGKPDIYSGNYLSQNVGILIGDGDGNFTLNGPYACGGNVWAMETADVDGDGVTDVVVANNGQSNAGVLRGNGTGGLLAVQTYAVGASPVWVELGDTDGDDDVDLVIASFSSATATLWRNNGAGIFTTPLTFAAQNAASSVVIVDHDRDGDSDVIVTDELADKAFIYRQNGPSPTSVQGPSCQAAVRVNSQAARGGFGGRPATPLPSGATAFLNLSGAPSVPFLLASGAPQAPGAVFPSGLLNLALAPVPTIVIDGFGGDPLGLLDAAGEAWFPVAIPAVGLSGVSLTIQALIAAPGAPSGSTFSNPETAIVL